MIQMSISEAFVHTGFL